MIQHTKNDHVIALGSTLKKGTVRFWVRDIGEGIGNAEPSTASKLLKTSLLLQAF